MITRLILTQSVEAKIWLRLVNSEIGFVKQTWKLLPIKLQNDQVKAILVIAII